MKLTITYDQFVNMYHPIRNPLQSDQPFNGCLFDTYGVEADFIHHYPGRASIWTLVEEDGELLIRNGTHCGNHLGYFLTCNVSSDGDEIIVVFNTPQQAPIQQSLQLGGQHHEQ